MNSKKLIPIAATSLVLIMTACSGGTATRMAHKDYKIYSAYIYDEAVSDYVFKENLTWKEAYDATVARTKVTTGDERNELLHQAEDILMSTGAICPLYYYTDNYLESTDLSGFYTSPLGYKFFQGCKLGTSTEFTVCVGPKGDSYDPALNSAVDGAIIVSHGFEGLMRWAKPDVGEVASTLECGQAESYDKVSNDDGTVTYTFTLRDGLKWSDGTELKASDFAKSWARAASGKLGADYGYMFDCVKGYDDTAADTTTYKPLSGVVANDTEGTIAVTINSDLPYFLELTAFPTYSPVRLDKIVKSDGSEQADWWTTAANYIGNGPMKVTTMDNKDAGSVVYEKNPYYWDADNVTASKVTFSLLDDDSTIYTNFKNNSYCFVDSMPNDVIDTEKDKPYYHVNGQLGTYYVIFNVNDASLNNYLKDEVSLAKFRKALGLFIDRNYICEEIGQAGQEPANTFVGKGIIENWEGEGAKDWTETAGPRRDGSGYYSVKKADFASNCALGVQMLKELGFHYDEEKGAFTDIPTISYLYNTGSGHQAIGEYLESAFSLFGVKLKLESQEWAVFLNTRKDGQYSIARNGWLADYNDACSFIDMWTTDSGNNDAQFGR